MSELTSMMNIGKESFLFQEMFDEQRYKNETR